MKTPAGSVRVPIVVYGHRPYEGPVHFDAVLPEGLREGSILRTDPEFKAATEALDGARPGVESRGRSAPGLELPIGRIRELVRRPRD